MYIYLWIYLLIYQFNLLFIYLSICIYTRLLGRFAPIFDLNCEHILFVYILKQKQKKVHKFHKKIGGFWKFIGNRILFADFIKKIHGFSKLNFFYKNKILIIHYPFLGSREIPQKIWARSVLPFWRLLDIYWIDIRYGLRNFSSEHI